MIAACGRTPTQLGLEERCAAAAVPVLACDDPCADPRWQVDATPADVLVALDRSCSMEPRWTSGLQGLREVVAARGEEVSWGITAFPDRMLNACEQGELLMPTAPGNANRIVALLGAATNPAHEMYPSGPCVTDIAAGIAQAATDPAFDQAGPHKVVILVTDGWETCGGQDEPPAPSSCSPDCTTTAESRPMWSASAPPGEPRP